MLGKQLTFFSSMALSKKSRSQFDKGVSFIMLFFSLCVVASYIIVNWCTTVMPQVLEARGRHLYFLNSAPDVLKSCHNKRKRGASLSHGARLLLLRGHCYDALFAIINCEPHLCRYYVYGPFSFNSLLTNFYFEILVEGEFLVHWNDVCKLVI